MFLSTCKFQFNILPTPSIVHRANEEEARQAALQIPTGINVTTPASTFDLSYHIIIYTVITATIFVFGLINALWMFHVMVSASKNLHNRMFAAIVRCPVMFFDTNPVGEFFSLVYLSLR